MQPDLAREFPGGQAVRDIGILACCSGGVVEEQAGMPISLRRSFIASANRSPPLHGDHEELRHRESSESGES
jgi:hypothetical protein